MNPRDFHCRQCKAAPGEPCVALVNRGKVRAGRTIVSPHVSRNLASKGLCPHGYKPENCGFCNTSSDISRLPGQPDGDRDQGNG